MCSLQSHFDELNKLILKFPISPSILCLSKTRINNDPSININIFCYIFIHLPLSTKAGGVGAYVSNTLKFAKNDYLRLNINGCDDLWLNIEISGEKSKFTFAVVYRLPCDKTHVFIETLDKRFHYLNGKGH